MKVQGKYFSKYFHINFSLRKHVTDHRARAILISALMFPSEVVSVGGDNQPPEGKEKK